MFLLSFLSQHKLMIWRDQLCLQHPEPDVLHALRKELEVKHMDVQRAVFGVVGTPLEELVPGACWDIPAQVIESPHLIQVVTHIRFIAVLLKVLYQLCEGRYGSTVIKRRMLPWKYVHCVTARTRYHGHLVQGF